MTRETALALSLALGGLVIVVDTTVTVVAVPVLVRVFDAPLATMQWTTTAYLLALVTTLPLSAWIAARVGTRRAYVAALLVFAAGSVWAAGAHGPAELIAARVVQGLGGGVINPLAFTLGLRDVPAARRGRVASLLGLPVLVGPALGPVLAGWLVDALSWRAIFLVTVAPALLAALLVARLGRDDDAVRTRPPLDVPGAALLTGGATVVVFGVGQETAPVGWRLGAVAVGLALVAAFVRRSLAHRTPLLRVRLLRDPTVAASLAVLVLFGAAYFGSMLLLPTYVQVTRGESALIAGSLGIPGGLATGVSLQVATRLVDRLPARRIVVGGLVTAGLALAATATVLRVDTPYVVLAALAAFLGLGAGAVLVPTMTTATRSFTGDDLAHASSILGLASQLASALGTAAITAVFAGLVSSRSGGLGLDAVSRLPGPLRAAVAPELVTAQRLTYLVTVALVAAAAVVAARRLGGTRRPTPTLKEHA